MTGFSSRCASFSFSGAVYFFLCTLKCATVSTGSASVVGFACRWRFPKGCTLSVCFPGSERPVCWHVARDVASVSSQRRALRGLRGYTGRHQKVVGGNNIATGVKGVASLGAGNLAWQLAPIGHFAFVEVKVKPCHKSLFATCGYPGLWTLALALTPVADLRKNHRPQTQT